MNMPYLMCLFVNYCKLRLRQQNIIVILDNI